jgi:hypothetical protein
MLDSLAGQLVVDVEPLLAVHHHPSLPQHAQLLGYIGLGPPQHRLEMAHTGLFSPQFVQDAQTGRVG